MVARRFPLSRRRDSVSFGHHAELCAFTDSEQDRWLDLAVRHGWSRAQLRHELRGDRSQAAASYSAVGVRLSLDPPRLERWTRAASDRGADLQKWIVTTLDDAADNVNGHEQ